MASVTLGDKPEVLALAPWMTFANARLRFGKPSVVAIKPSFLIDHPCEGNYGFCGVTATHLLVLVDDEGAMFRLLGYTYGVLNPWHCEMTTENSGEPVYLPVCDKHLTPFTDEKPPNQLA